MNEQLQSIDYNEVDKIVASVGGDSHHVIQILQKVQERFHYLPNEVLDRICRISEITPSRIVGVASFYSQFRFTPSGKHRIKVCHGTACHVKGSVAIHEAIHRYLDLPEHKDTTSDLQFTVEKIACLGCCTLAPVVQIGETVYGQLSAEKIPPVIRNYLSHPDNDTKTNVKHISSHQTAVVDGEIRIGLGSCCVAKGSAHLYDAIQTAIHHTGTNAVIKRVGCVGMCHQTPLIEVVVPGKPPSLYANLDPGEASTLVLRHFRQQSTYKKLKYTTTRLLNHIFEDNPQDNIDRYSIHRKDEPVSAFLRRQDHIATEHAGVLNPFDLTEYVDHGGFKGLSRCLQDLNQEQVIREIRESGLRGRGGAGFHSSVKWEKVSQAQACPKYVICNGDEGDPGAFMDRMLLESFPYRIIEGMAIAAYAVNAQQGLLYVRAEYPLALKVLREALKHCYQAGYLGDQILGTPFSFHVDIAEGAGAFVSGEETALLASVEGRRSVPRLRPPYPAEEGLWGQPTLINNVETYALVPWILSHGHQAFTAIGTRKSKGTKVFALAGKVARGGLIEVPMGITIREVVEEIGGGIAGGHKFKAVQVGGPSGGCIPASHGNTSIDFEALGELGAIMGSGGLVVLDETDCMVDIARYFLQFTQNESCGKCTLCRIGSKRMLEIVTAICEGKAKEQDLTLLEHLAKEMQRASFCGLGKTAPNPVLTSLKYFRNEYEAHLKGHCPAGKCKALITYSINQHCVGCTICAQHCPVQAIEPRPYKVHEIDETLCTRCDLCRSVCPENAVVIT
jgi:NADH:ubiquinone oxidoreductase subunit F (NADH-binding)/NADH:ubiquinone oxidoreductase subunit E/Pyruvate/2-oxoacid:ferredoxin oxidoreductase delta subunit